MSDKPKKGDNPFMNGVDAEELIITPEQKAEMFKEKENEIVKQEGKDQRLVALVEPSLKKRLVEYADELDVKYAVVIRAAISEYLEKRGR